MDNEIILRFLLAILLGGAIGAEREYRGKNAGFRTMIMISLGCCFFTMLSRWIGNTPNQDRMAANIVTGIGFLGAGVIFKEENTVKGITTAATIWTVAALGVGLGAGYYFASIFVAIITLFILGILPFFENLIDKYNTSKTYIIKCNNFSNLDHYFEKILQDNQLKYKLTNQVYNETTFTFRWLVHGSIEHHNFFVKRLLVDKNVKEFEYSL